MRGGGGAAAAGLIGLGGPWIYGPGSDGARTLVGNVTETGAENVKQYTTFNLGGFTYTYADADSHLVVYASELIENGVISARGKGPGAANSGGAGGASPGGSTGGAGGAGAGALYIYARAMDTVELRASGGAGVNGVSGSAANNNHGGNGSLCDIGAVRLGPLNKTLWNSAYTGKGGLRGSVGAGGSAAALGVTDRGHLTKLCKDTLRHIGPGMDINSSADGRPAHGQGGYGGGGGASNAAGGGPIIVPGGGGGSGGGSIFGDGGAGGNGAAPAGINTDSVSGGAGGGGGGGGCVHLFTESAVGVTVNVNGGAGGNGAGGFNEGKGGGGGGGGGGGFAFGVYSGDVTVASGGGAGGVGGTDAQNGSAGGAGLSSLVAA